MRKNKQVEEKRVTFEMQEWQRSNSVPQPRIQIKRAGKPSIRILALNHKSDIMMVIYGDIFAAGNGGFMFKTVRTAMTRKAAVT